MTVFNVLEQKCNIFGKKVLEASAGTGKTFAIEHIIVRLLVESSSLLTLDQILVVTFTKSATKELQFRIRNNLQKAINFLNNSENNNLFNYLESFKKNKEAIFKLQNAIDLFETAQIFTIHSFCFKNLREFSLEANVLIEDENEIENSVLIRKLIYDYFKFHINSDEYSNEQIEILLNSHIGIDNLVQKILREFGRYKQKKEFKNFNEIYNSFLEKLKNFEKIDTVITIQHFYEIEGNYKKNQKFKNDNFIKQLKFIIKFINKKYCSKDEFKKLLKTKCSVFEFLSEKNQKLAKSDFVLSDLFYQIKEKLYPIIKEAINPKILFHRVFHNVSCWINQFLDNNEILTFDKILIKMKNAIRSKSFKKKLQAKYKAVIIDEFQDTDPIQFEIFDKLFFSNKDVIAVYLIGDPKQSIYSFRNADLYTYLNATKKIKEIKYLDTNYRSSKALIDSLNALFGESFAKKWLVLPQINKSLTYSSIKSGLNINFDFKDDLASIHFFLAEDDNKSQKWPTDIIERKYFSFIKNEIMKLKIAHRFEDGDFAVLVKDRYQAQRLKSYFDRFFIQSVTAKKSSLKDSTVLNAMKEFLEAVVFPFDLNKIKIALKGPFIQIGDEVLKNFDFEKNAFYIEKFYLLREILHKGNSFFFNSFFYSSWPNKTILENITSTKDIKFYQEVINLVEILISKNLTPNQLINFIKELEEFDEEDENLKIGKTSFLGVQILTTFMSKGLEYKIVFALSLVNRNVDKFSENIEEMDAEKMRQFYVALTRAKYRVYIPIALDIQEKEIKEGNFSCIEYFFTHILESKNLIEKKILLEKLEELKSKNHITYSFVNDLNLKHFYDLQQNVHLNSNKQFTRKFLQSYTYSFSSLQKEKINEIDIKNEIIDFPKGPQIGVVIHNIFEKILNKKNYEKNIIRKIILDNIIDTELEEFEDKIFELVKKALETPLLNEKGFCLKDVSFEDMRPEVEFLFSVDNNYIKGFIDLIFMYDNKYYIIDWKMNYLGNLANDYGLENIKRQMSSHNYYLQAAIYTESLKRHLNVVKKEFIQCFGGVFYIFLRGFLFDKRQEIYHFFPDSNLLNCSIINNIGLKNVKV